MAIRDKGPVLTNTVAVFLALAYFTAGLRFYVRFVMKRTPGIDDLFAAIALVTFTGLCAVMFWGAQQGIGRHFEDLDLPRAVNGIMAIWIGCVVYVFSACFIKISFGLSLLRILQAPSHRWAMYILISSEIILTVVYFAVSLIVCRPVNHLWMQLYNPEGGRCLDAKWVILVTYLSGGIALLTDIVLAVVPALMVRKIQMSRRNKITVAVLLALGSIASVASIARMVYAPRLRNIDQYLYTNTEMMIWSTIEIGISLICTSASTLRPLGEKLHFFPAFANSLRTTTRSRNTKGYQLSGDNLGGTDRGRMVIKSTTKVTQEHSSRGSWYTNHPDGSQEPVNSVFAQASANLNGLGLEQDRKSPENSLSAVSEDEIELKDVSGLASRTRSPI